MVSVPHEVPPAFQLFMGPSAMVALYRVGGARPYWLAAARLPQGGKDAEGMRKQTVLDRFRGWSDEVISTIELTEEGAINRTDIVDRPPLETWGEGRVTLLGDAAHAMTLHLGQGAGTALEDSVVLARALSEHSNPVEGLRAYERKRIARTTPLVKQSRRFGQLYTVDNGAGRSLRNRFLGMLSQKGVAKREHKLLEWV
jgi:2-polyprenyl-6-methoxyphenol hydroxylase-like FAD-dependent oxidoreductase